MTGARSDLRPAAALDELKAFLRVEGAAEDAVLAQLLAAATETVEAIVGRVLIEREIEEIAIVRRGRARLGHEPVRSLVTVEQRGPDGQWAGVPGARLEPGADGSAHVVADALGDEPVEVRLVYRAGVAVDWNWVPEALRLAVLRAAAHFHAHRDAPDDPGLPAAVARLVQPWRARRLT